MRYKKAIDLWNPEIQENIINGRYKIQRGQWVKCGSVQLSRFVKTTGRSLWVAHPQKTPKATLERFKTLCSIA